MSNSRCKAITASGERCRLKAGSSGYCHIHDPKKIAERAAARKAAEEARRESWAKGGRLREVIEVIKLTCKAKGWEARTVSQDRESWRYATISAERSVPSGSGFIGYERVRGVFDISVDDGVKVSCQQTSSYGYGLRDLRDAIMAEIRRLPWIEPPKKTPQVKIPQAKPLTPLQQLERLIRRFHIVAGQLGHRHNDRKTLIIEDEYDVQDLFHALLRTIFDDVRPEEVTPTYAGASSRVDFLLKNEKIVVEVKMASTKLKDKKIGEQLIIDIKRYQSHPDCETLVCFVYDPDDHIRNPSGLENDLSRRHDNLEVRVFVVPR